MRERERERASEREAYQVAGKKQKKKNKKKLPANATDKRDISSIPRLGRSPGEGNENPLQYTYLEYLVDRGSWQARTHGVAELDTIECKHTHTHTEKITS